MRLVAIIIGILLGQSLNAQDKTIYGEDNRRDIYEVSNSFYLDVAESTAAMVSDDHIRELDGESVVLIGKTLQDKGICESERFSQQLAIAECSGFLIAPNLVATAGHCVLDLNDCHSYNWIFGYRVRPEQTEIKISKKDIYRCKNIITRNYDRRKKDDYAIIQLDREVEDRVPLDFRKSGKIDKDSRLVMVGHPSGLPAKVTNQAFIRKNYKSKYFVTTLDTFAGNSGSPVLNEQSQQVEGILVRGDVDYKLDRRAFCSRAKRCRERGCYGADVTRITEIEFLQSL